MLSAFGKCVPYTVFKMIFQDYTTSSVKRRAYGSYLNKHFRAIPPRFYHSLYTTYMAFNTSQPIDDLRVDVFMVHSLFYIPHRG